MIVDSQTKVTITGDRWMLWYGKEPDEAGGLDGELKREPYEALSVYLKQERLFPDDVDLVWLIYIDGHLMLSVKSLEELQQSPKYDDLNDAFRPGYSQRFLDLLNLKD